MDDFGFVPVFRADDGLTDAAPHCPQWTWRRDALLAGDAAAAAKDWPEEFLADRPHERGRCPDGEPLGTRSTHSWRGPPCPRPSRTRGPGDPGPARVRRSLEPVLDSRQNLLRWAGDLAGAREEAARWAVHVGGETALAHQRLGEIDFLLKDYRSAAAEFATAAVRLEGARPGQRPRRRPGAARSGRGPPRRRGGPARRSPCCDPWCSRLPRATAASWPVRTSPAPPRRSHWCRTTPRPCSVTTRSPAGSRSPPRRTTEPHCCGPPP